MRGMKLLDMLTDYLDFVYFLLFPYFIIINKWHAFACFIVEDEDFSLLLNALDGERELFMFLRLVSDILTALVVI